ncbi:short-chain dehydrogenase/reductase family 42E member 1-like isoform X2 [Eriocheir sinensis]|nr:short-chain dehydrogenase/reductase family 42E member 1-like isoform X2 [Eriocheir sinensis]XP_050709437.1 short-chain dehydrogenase/reductase family 42E member 1-like isoform X2 [Eriocheir sinensis]
MTKVVITGGGGYVGYHIGWALSRGGHPVTLLDLKPPDPEWSKTAPRALWDSLPPGFWSEETPDPGPLEFVEGSVTNPHDLQTHFEGAEAVIHTASYGMSGRDQLTPHAPMQEKVNIEGTREVIEAAVKAKVRALVHTSTYNVIFGGDEIVKGDETMPFYPIHTHTDYYSVTKAIAERLVLMADGKCDLPATPSTPGPHAAPQPRLCPLRTCSLRMNGVMGLGEKQHSPRIISAMRSGLLVFAFGRRDGLTDFIGIQNAVQAHLKAMKALLKEQSLSTQDFPAIPSTSGKILSCEKEEGPIPSSGDSSPSSLSKSDRVASSSSGASEPTVASRLEDVSACTVGSNSLSVLPSRVSSPSSSTPTVASKSKAPVACTETSNPSSGPTRVASKPSVSGQAFFINDAAPVSYFDYFQPLFEGLGYSFPAVTLPLYLILVAAYIQAVIYCLVHKFFPFSPFVTPSEAYKSVTHYCSSRKAMEAFDYSPTRPNDLKQMVEYYRARGCTNKMRFVSLMPVALCFLLPLLVFVVVI